MATYLLDTNVLSEMTRPRPDAKVVEFFAQESDLWLSAISFDEFRFGAEIARDTAKRMKLDIWIAELADQFKSRCITVDRQVAEQSGRLRAIAQAKGRGCDPVDALIAASAMSRNLILATRNIKDFEHFGVRLMNPWLRD